MIATFIYTECQSPGTFKSEPGFKVKDVKVWKTKEGKIFHDKVGPHNSQELEKYIMDAVGSLPYFEPPAMSPFITKADFLKLEKQWIYLSLGEGYKVFARMATTGLTHGRRGNPFLMGVLFHELDLQGMRNFWSKAAKNAKQVFSPADLYSWSGWQDPRTSEELEETTLSADQFPTPILLPKIRPIDDRNYLIQQKSAIKTALVSIQEAILKIKPAVFSAEDSWHFLKQASIVSAFLPTDVIWSMSVSSTPNVNEYQGRSGWRKALLHGAAEQTSPKKDSWASLCLKMLESDRFAELEPMLYLLSRGLRWKRTDGASALTLLPLAVVIQSTYQNDFLTEAEVEQAWQLIERHLGTDEVEYATKAFKDSVLPRAKAVTLLGAEQREALVKVLDALPTRN